MRALEEKKTVETEKNRDPLFNAPARPGQAIAQADRQLLAIFTLSLTGWSGSSVRCS